MPRFGVLTLSFNKPGWIGDAIMSVLNQTLGDFYYAVVDNSTVRKDEVMSAIKSFVDPRLEVFEEVLSDDVRRANAVNWLLYKKYVRVLQARGCEIIHSLADDDILYHDCLSEIDRFFKETPEAKTCYHWCHYYAIINGEKSLLRDCAYECVFDANNSPSCIVGDPMFAFHSSVMDVVAPEFEISKQCESVADGVWMSRVACTFPIRPLKKFLMEARALEESCYGSRVHWQGKKNGGR